MAMDADLKESILGALENVIDPELGIDIVFNVDAFLDIRVELSQVAIPVMRVMRRSISLHYQCQISCLRPCNPARHTVESSCGSLSGGEGSDLDSG